MQFNFLRYRSIYYIFSGALVIGSIFVILTFGLRFGIEFTGGSMLEVEYDGAPPSPEDIRNRISEFNLGDTMVQSIGENGVLLRFQPVDEETHQKILEKLEAKERRFELIGPVIGEELKRDTIIAIILSTLAIMVYIAFAFRGVSRPVPSWHYGVIAAMVAFFHDVLIPLGVFAVLGETAGVEISIPIIAAFLTVLGFSINDTVVVFDRVRENLLRRTGIDFEDTVNKSLNQTLARSLNISLTALFVLMSLFFFGGETIRYFSLALIVGMISGTYSSIFLASPLLVTIAQRKKKTET